MFPFFVRGYNRFWDEWLVNDVNLSFYIKEKLLKCKQETTEKKKKQNKVKKLHISDSCSLLIQLRNEEQSIKMHLDKLTLFIKIFAAPLKPFSHEKACIGHVTYIHRFVLWWLDMCVSFLFLFFLKSLVTTRIMTEINKRWWGSPVKTHINDIQSWGLTDCDCKTWKYVTSLTPCPAASLAKNEVHYLLSPASYGRPKIKKVHARK